MAELHQQASSLAGRGDRSLNAQQREILLAAAQAQRDEIRAEIEQYEALRDGRTPVTQITSIDDLRLALIRGRISRGWTQAQLADACGVPEQQVQRDEVNRYGNVGLDRLQKIAERLGVRFAGVAALPAHETDPPCERHERWRKPLLLMLVQNIKLRHRRSVEGHLEMQKLTLLLEQRLRSRLCWSVFSFEPYLYGAFDPELEDDLDFLEQFEFVRKRVRGTKSDMTTNEPERIVSIEPGRNARVWLESFLENEKLGSPDTKQRVVAAVDEVVEAHGASGREELLSLTYATFPQLTSRSTIKDRVHATRAMPKPVKRRTRNP